MVMGFKETAIALAVLSLVLSSSVGAMLWSKGREIRAVDDRVLGRVEENESASVGEQGMAMKRWESVGSFMEV